MTTLFVTLSNISANPWQTRQGEPNAEYIKTLALDIVANGLLQLPIGRFYDPNDSESPVQLAFGHNRLAAYRWLCDLRDNSDIPGDWSKMPVDVRELSDEQMADMAWAENDKRQDFTPLERAMAIRKRMDDFKWSQKDIAEHLRISAPVVSNALRLLDLPTEILEYISSGAISERAALSLLTLFDLPAGLRDEAEKSAYSNHKPSYIVKQAQDGASSDTLRDLIDSMVHNHSKDLNKAIWNLDYTFLQSEIIYWPDCRSCELRHKSLNVCTNPTCYEAKGQAWVADYLQQASAVSGILPLESDIPYYQITYLEYRRSAESILTSGCENLRLVFSPYGERGPFTLADKGYPKAMIVCRKGNGYCKCLQGVEILAAQKRREEIQRIQDTAKEPEDETDAEAEANAQPFVDDEAEIEQPDPEQEWEQRPQRPTAEELAELVKEEKKRQKENAKLAKSAQEQAVQIITDALADNEPGAWRLIYNRVALGEPWKDRPDDISEIRKGIAARIVTYQVQYVDPSQVVDKLKEWLTGAGLPELQL